jgi:hypothetical protein
VGLSKIQWAEKIIFGSLCWTPKKTTKHHYFAQILLGFIQSDMLLCFIKSGTMAIDEELPAHLVIAF